MTTRQRLLVLVACVVVVLGAAWFAGSEGGGPTAPPPPPGSVRLGPEPGEAVAAYRERAAATLPAAGEPVLALVSLTTTLPTDRAAALGRPVVAVLRVPLPRIQTALRFEPLEPQVPAVTALSSARERAATAAAADAARTTGRAQRVAQREAAVLAEPGCACVAALVVQGNRAALDSLLRAPAVRVVEAAPAGVTARELALAPLLPEQADRADPLPDDGEP